MDNNNGNVSPLGGDDSRIEAADSNDSVVEQANAMMNAWLFAMRLKKYRDMKKLEEVSGLREETGVSRDFHSSSPGDGRKVDDTADADAVAFEGDAGPDVSFVERDAPGVMDAESEESGGVPAC